MADSYLLEGAQKRPIGERPSSSRPIGASLRRIVFALAAPAIAGLGALASGLYSSERELLSQNVTMATNALAARLDQQISSTIAAARVLAESPSIASQDFAAFHRQATLVLPLLQGYTAVLGDDTGRQIVNTLLPYGSQLPSSSNGPIRETIFRTGEPMISDLFTGPTTVTHAVAVYVPVVVDGRVKYTIGVGVSPSTFARILHEQRLPKDWASAVIDSAGIIVAHSHRPELIGTVAPARPSQLSTKQDLVETVRADGTPVYAGLQKSGISKWGVGVSVPVANFYRKPGILLMYGGVGTLFIVLTGLVVAAYESKRIARAVNGLIPSALALGRGETPFTPPSGVREIEEVALELDRTHLLLEKRKLERDRAVSKMAERSFADEILRLAVEACPSGMVMTESDGTIVMINTETEQLFGYTRAELVGKSVDLLIPQPLRAKHVASRDRFMAAPECRRMGAGRDLFGCRKDGSELPIEVGLNPIRAGDRLMVLAVIVDISHRKRAERLKDEFVATVSHELRTPLTSISASLGLLAGQWTNKLPESAARLLKIAHANSQRLVRLVNDILDIEKMEAGQIVFNMDRIDLHALIANAIEDNRGFAANFRVKIRLDDTSVKHDVNADPDRLSQVITNLLSNAIKFSPPGEEVVISIEERLPNVHVSVRDHGPGVPAEFKSHIFEKFAQADATNARKKGGTGLGLSIVKQIVERLGGQVGFTDAPDGGTIFFVDLPIWNSEVGGEIDLDADPAAPRLLFCEDQREEAIGVREHLRREGFAVDFAHTLNAAITRSEATRYAAIIVDLKLPDGDGIGLIVRLRAQAANRRTPIIVLSGDPEKGKRDPRAAALHVLHWLEKPVSFKPLVEIVRTETGIVPRARPRVLHIDDDADILAAVEAKLRQMVEVISVSSINEARRILSIERIDLAILDVALGKESGLDLLPQLRGSAGNIIPVIIFAKRRNIEQQDGQFGPIPSDQTLSLEKLADAVRDRLALSPAHFAEGLHDTYSPAPY